MGAGFQFQRLNLWLSWWEAWPHTGKQGIGEVTVNSTSRLADSSNRVPY